MSNQVKPLSGKVYFETLNFQGVSPKQTSKAVLPREQLSYSSDELNLLVEQTNHSSISLRLMRAKAMFYTLCCSFKDKEIIGKTYILS